MKAFPSFGKTEYAFDGVKWVVDRDQGMDLRDYFAAKAMQGMLSYGMSYSDSIAQSSYEFADAMMKAREK